MSIFDINLNLLKSFWAVYKTGGVNRGAKMLDIAPPVVTYNIKQLEKQLGKKLFYTDRKGTQHTGDASELFPLVEDAFGSLLKYNQQLNAANKGTVKIGLTTMHASFFLVKFTQEFRKKYPDIRLEFVHQPQHDYLPMLENNEIDVAIFQFTRKPDENITFFDLMTEKMTFWTTRKFAEAHGFNDEITLEQLHSFPLVLFRLAALGPTFNQLEDSYGKFQKIVDAPSTHTAYAMVMDGQGIGFFFEKYLDAQNTDEILRLKIKDMPPPPVRVYECAHYKKPSAIVSLLIKELKEFYSL